MTTFSIASSPLKATTTSWLRWQSRVNTQKSLIFAVAVDITQEKETLRLLSEAKHELELALGAEKKIREQAVLERDRFQSLIMQSPALAAMLRGPRHVFELANDRYKLMVGDRDIIGKPLKDAIPMIDPGILQILDQVYLSGQRHVGKSTPVAADWLANGEVQVRSFDFVYEPTYGEDSQADGVWIWAVDVTGGQTDLHAIRSNVEAGLISANRSRLGSVAHILVIDDQEEISSALMIGLHEHEVLSRSNFTEALALLTQAHEHYDLILCESSLHGMTSRNFLEILEKQLPNLLNSVVVMSAGTPDTELAKWLTVNSIPYLQKPFRLSDVKALIAGRLNAKAIS